MKFGLKDNNIDDIIRIIATFPEVDGATLYGSRAKGNYKPGSDIDLVLTGGKLNLSLLNKISLKLDDLYLPYSFDLSIFNHIDNAELLEHIKRAGVILYNRIVV